mmetsp:Transcript_32297/g.27251  ORF Transcript_32297/g.27251 Transcript_32297/m.27251 type:complete len:219 (-) Transcript_32297:7-663(-)
MPSSVVLGVVLGAVLGIVSPVCRLLVVSLIFVFFALVSGLLILHLFIFTCCATIGSGLGLTIVFGIVLPVLVIGFCSCGRVGAVDTVVKLLLLRHAGSHLLSNTPIAGLRQSFFDWRLKVLEFGLTQRLHNVFWCQRHLFALVALLHSQLGNVVDKNGGAGGEGDARLLRDCRILGEGALYDAAYIGHRKPVGIAHCSTPVCSRSVCTVPLGATVHCL